MFPAVPLEDGYFGDGALRLTAPLSPAIRMGARRLLVIGGRDDQNDAGPTEPSYPTIGEMAGHALDILFNDNLDADHERLSRINKTVRLLPQEALDQTDLRVIETLMLEPSRDLREIAVQYADEVPGTIKLLMRSIGSWGQEGRLSSYLLFEPGYVGALVDLGYSDTLDRAEEVREFLAPSHDPADQAPKAG
jgi:NTE family protein